MQAAPAEAGSHKQAGGGARATVSQQREQRWQKQIEKARKQLERERCVAEWDRECEEVGHLMNLGREGTTEDSQRLQHLRPVCGMFAEYGEDYGLRRRRKQAEQYRKQDKHAVMTLQMRLAAGQKQARLELELEQELEPAQELELEQLRAGTGARTRTGNRDQRRH